MSQTITITIDEPTRHALAKTLDGHALSAEVVAARMFHQFAHNAPREIVAFIAHECGSPSNMWAEFGRAERVKERATLAPELALVEAIRVVVGAKR